MGEEGKGSEKLFAGTESNSTNKVGGQEEGKGLAGESGGGGGSADRSESRAGKAWAAAIAGPEAGGGRRGSGRARGFLPPDQLSFPIVPRARRTATDPRASQAFVRAACIFVCSQNNLTDGEEDLPEDAFSLLPALLVGFLFLVLIFLSVAGNVLVCVAIYTDRGLRRIGNLFLASLAIADLFVGCLVMTFAGVNDLLGYWVFGPRFCDTWIAFDVMCSTASILNLCAISLDRYVHIKDPLRYGRWMTRRTAVAGIVVVWLLAGLISFLPISLGLHRAGQPMPYDDEIEEHPTCALDLAPIYAVVSSSISFFVPCVVMLGIYSRLYCYAQKHVKSIRAVTKLPDTSMAKSFRGKSGRSKPPKPQTKTKPTSPYHVSDHKAAVTVGVIMGVFLICWVPFFTVNIVVAYCKSCISGRAFQVLTWLGYSNSAFNPIIYSIFNTEFREAFKRILTKGARARGNQPSTSECGEFRSVVVQKRNGSMVECNISPRSSADSCQVGPMAQRHRDTIVSAI
ncbi:hypothetical protein KM043_006158 [Ampulex compressa]|nr:hypothetical protein KM043_006158 [Ampulex compressa]